MKDNPYVGPRPYGRKDRDNFYEHNRKARGLLAKIMAERVVLFYVQSGAGKSSLLNAKIIPALEGKITTYCRWREWEASYHLAPI